ncbi:HPr family phosphocarrier protein [Domibacillus sp. DTU_2020_1001157_1_SI_ALB_TIR_016]|uniref:HPr family phosphocarrier protein n=1 Tax=Domibacillus sp. DTU_2020_1001157_1_SI_ALB_TIR_016 TaxID=3077789 RepID=UPI0028EDB084|nr:HPr family phosphocarrier protein [Domibacillus sp. DTU_2020_1001157_1_SI_ALB_TIR_016]WNS81561.1 HPr family phosphocarrier protein [Domibacillus sp. DTU_2020_1001157_1_SI_ALB_TIR_016]
MFVKTVYIRSFTPKTAVPLVHLASQFVSDIYLQYQNRHVNVKSIMGVLALGSPNGEMTLTAKGIDEYEAIKAIGAALEQTEIRPVS